MLLDKRVAERDQRKVKADIILPDADTPLPCISGACLIVPDDACVPTRFELLLPITLEIVHRRNVEVKWQRDRTLGVCFGRS